MPGDPAIATTGPPASAARIRRLYGLSAAAGLVALALPVAIVTGREDQVVSERVSPVPQALVLIAVGLALVGGRLRHAWPVWFGLSALLAAVGGLLGSVGTDLLIDAFDSDSGGHAGPGAPVVGLAGGFAVAAVVLDAHARLVRLNPTRQGAGAWTAVLLLATPVPLVGTALAAGVISTLVLLALLLPGYALGRAILALWRQGGRPIATTPGHPHGL